MQNLAWAITNLCDLYGKTTRVLTAINFITGNRLILQSIFGCSQIKQRKLEPLYFDTQSCGSCRCKIRKIASSNNGQSYSCEIENFSFIFHWLTKNTQGYQRRTANVPYDFFPARHLGIILWPSDE